MKPVLIGKNRLTGGRVHIKDVAAQADAGDPAFDAAPLRAPGRLNALARCGVLDGSARGDEFGDLAALVAGATGMAGAAVTFVDGEREHVRGAHGLDLGDVPVERSLGARAVLSSQRPFLVPDTAADDACGNCDWVTGPARVRAYAALSLVTAGGTAIGTVCVADTEPRAFVPEVTGALERIARIVLAQLEQQSGERYRLLAENATDMISSHSLDGAFTYASSAARTLLGFEPEELVGHSAYDVMHPDDAPRIRRLHEQLLAGGDRRRANCRVRHRDGRWVWVEIVARMVRDQHGEPVLQAATRDIGEQQRALEALANAEERFRTAFDEAPIGIAIFGLDRRIQRVNKALCATLGYSPEEVLGMRGRDFTHPDDVEATERELDRLAEGVPGAMRLEKRHRHKDGYEIWSEVTGTLMRDAAGRSIGFLAQVQDITARKLAEQQTREARDAAERANRAKSEFLSRMSHEVRTPLNAVLGFAQLLELEDLDPQQRESVARIITGGHHLLGLINDVLDISRIEAGQLPISLAPVRVERAVNEAVALLAPLARQRSIEVHADLGAAAGLELHADRQRLEQVLLNLISNAIKFGPEGSSVRVTGEARDGQVRIAVIDQGPGIPEPDRARLFVPFERLDAAAHGVEGTGLGLALSRNIIEAMHGAIGVASGPEGGAASGSSCRWRRSERSRRAGASRPRRMRGRPAPLGRASPAGASSTSRTTRLTSGSSSGW